MIIYVAPNSSFFFKFRWIRDDRNDRRFLLLVQLRKYNIMCTISQMWSIHVPCAAQYKNAVQIMLEDIDAVVRMVEDSGGSTLVTKPDGE